MLKQGINDWIIYKIVEGDYHKDLYCGSEKYKYISQTSA